MTAAAHALSLSLPYLFQPHLFLKRATSPLSLSLPSYNATTSAQQRMALGEGGTVPQRRGAAARRWAEVSCGRIGGWVAAARGCGGGLGT